MTTPLLTLLDALQSRGWTVTRRDPARPLILGSNFREHYASPPVELEPLLHHIAACVSPNEARWLLTEQDFADEPSGAWHWNEHERMSLDAADVDERADIEAFWRAHVPFMFAVDSEYDYLALCIAGANRGAVVHGCAPMFEDVTVVAPSFEAWLGSVLVALRDGGDDLVAKVFFGVG